MAGRYGSDRLNQCLLGAALVLILISAIGGRWVQWMSILSLLAYIPLIWSIYRMYSRNIEARPPGKHRLPAVFQPPDG